MSDWFRLSRILNEDEKIFKILITKITEYYYSVICELNITMFW